MRRWSVRIFILLVLMVPAAFFMKSDWVQVKDIQLELDKNSPEVILFERIKLGLKPQLDSLHGQFFWNVRLKNVYESILRDRRVKSVGIYRQFPSVLKIVIEPHTPVLAYLARDGRFYPVATDGTLLPAIKAQDAADTPLLRGEELKDELSLRELAVDLFAKIPSDGTFNKAQISEIFYSRRDGFQIFVSGAKAEVKMGDSDFGPKVSRVAQVLNYLDSQNIKGRVIDARFSKKVVVRVRKAP